MTTSQSEEKKSRTLAQDPQYFGGYLNQARLNVLCINNDLVRVVGRKDLANEENILNSIFCNAAHSVISERPNMLFEKLVRLMPVVKQFDSERLPKSERLTSRAEGKNVVKMAKILKEVLSDVQQFRNDYTHYYSTEKGTERKLEVSETTAQFLTTSFARAIEYTKERFATELCDADFDLVRGKKLLDGNMITTEGLVFLTSMFLDRENAFQFIGKIEGLKGTQFKSFIATREVLMAYCVYLPHEKVVSSNRKQALMLDLLNELNRCPKILYDVLDEKEREQFRPALTDEAGQNIIENSISPEEKDDAFDDDTYQQYMEALTAKVRHNDRFFYHALRYIDETDALKDFNFHIDLGKYEVKEYPKTILGEEVKRSIVVRPKAFGKLTDFESVYDVAKMMGAQVQPEKFEPFAPHYNMDINKIGIARRASDDDKISKLNSQTGKMEHPQPVAFLSLHELSKVIILEKLKPGAANTIIQSYLSGSKGLYDMGFVKEIERKMPEWRTIYKRSADKSGRTYNYSLLKEIARRKKDLDKVLAEYNLTHKRIPERILNYWIRIEDVSTERTVEDRIKAMIRDGRSRLKLLSKHNENREIKIPRVGEMATFIAKDIVSMVIDKEAKSRITSVYYDRLQQCLAYYADAQKKEEFLGLMKELRLNNRSVHPFLADISPERITKTSEFYRKYLSEKVDKSATGRKSWMHRTFETMVEKNGRRLTKFRLPDDERKIPCSMSRWATETQPLKKYLESLSDPTYNQSPNNKSESKPKFRYPIDLPTDLFDQTLTDLLAAELKKHGVAVGREAKYNILLKQWWKTVIDDDVQPFYKYRRCYTIKGEQLTFEMREGGKFADYYADALKKAFRKLSNQREDERRMNRRLPRINWRDVEKSFKRILNETEKQIRITAEHDCAMLVMANTIGAEWNLDKLKLREDIEMQLNKSLNIEREFAYRFEFDEAGTKLTNEADYRTVKLKVKAEMKLKNVNNLNRFRCDRRMPGLTTYIGNGAEIDMNLLRAELNCYERSRAKVFDAVFDLERAIVEKNREDILSLFVDNAESRKSGNISHKCYLHWLRDKGIVTDEQLLYLNAIRNSFSHNQFPHKAIARQELSETMNTAKHIADEYRKTIDRIIDDVSRL